MKIIITLHYKSVGVAFFLEGKCLGQLFSEDVMAANVF